MDSKRHMLGCEPLADVIRSLLVREDDTRGTQFRKYFDIAKDVYRELQLSAIRYTKRVRIEIDKRNNSIKLPEDTMMITSLQVVDECGRLIPLILNKNNTKDLIDIHVHKDCKCACGCQDELCGMIKNYEVVYATVLAPVPGGITQQFETYSRKTIYPNGDYFYEYNVPVPKYEDGEIIETILEEKKEFICKLDMLPCGCIKPIPENKNKIEKCCGPNSFYVECGAGACDRKTSPLTYYYEQYSDRVEFDSDFNFDSIILRYFPVESGKDMMVPYAAKKTLMLGIRYHELLFDKSTGQTAIARQRQQVTFLNEYRSSQAKLFRLLNRLGLRTFYSTIIPKRKMV